jgi:hypothetical protein
VSLPAAPGDVIAVWTGAGPSQDAIRIGDVLEGKPAVANHVALLTHADKTGRWMGMEGRPGGFGLRDCTPWLSDPRTATNHDQPKTGDQVRQLLALFARLTGTPYDWCGIGEDALRAVGWADAAAAVDRLWRWPSDRHLLPGHVVCSSAAAFAYHATDPPLAHPGLGHERTCSPGDWWAFSNEHGWAAA